MTTFEKIPESLVPAFHPYPKTPRLFRDVVITEKLDGSNACIFIDAGGTVIAGSRNGWLLNGKDNFGFAGWVRENREELLKLGPGTHYGEWWGKGIQRGYGLTERRFSLFNVARWRDGATKTDPATGERTVLSPRPACCHVVPVLYEGEFLQGMIHHCCHRLEHMGSYAVPGYMEPEGVIVFHTASRQCFKVLLENDDKPKGERP